MTAAASLEKPLPRQIRERIERTQALLEAQETHQGTPPIETPPQGDETNPEVVPADTAPPQELQPQDDLQPYRDPALATDPRANDPSYWRHRVSVLQGKLAEERRLSDAREAALKGKVSELEGQIRALKSSAPSANPDLATVFSPEQIEAIGEDQAAAILTATVKAAQQRVEAALSEQRAADEAARASAQELAQQHRQRAFIDELDEAAPNWREIDKRQDWLNWLGQIDPRTGQTRQAALDVAKGNADARSIAALVNTFVATLQQPRTPPVTAPTAGPGPTPSGMPSNSRDLSQTPPTKAEIDEFFKRASVNGGRGVTPQERAAFEARLKLL